MRKLINITNIKKKIEPCQSYSILDCFFIKYLLCQRNWIMYANICIFILWIKFDTKHKHKNRKWEEIVGIGVSFNSAENALIPFIDIYWAPNMWQGICII